MSGWFWIVGSMESVAYDGVYDGGEFETRDDAIAGGRAAFPGESFWIIHATYGDPSPDDEPRDPECAIPFADSEQEDLIEVAA